MRPMGGRRRDRVAIATLFSPGPETGIAGVAPLCPTFSFFPGPIQDMAGQASAACSAPLPRLHACLPSGVARKTGGPALKTTPRGSPGWGWGCEVETCEARGLGGGLRARFPRWDTILCMRTKRPTTKKQRSSANPSSASNAGVGVDFRRGACGARFLLETRARPDFLLGIDWRHRCQSIHHEKSCGQPKVPPRWLHRERGVLRRKRLDAHRFRVMHGGFGI